MADEGFFDHTDPSGASPWDRAAQLGNTDHGGENKARGQADAAAVMDAWMNRSSYYCPECQRAPRPPAA
jgi:uncharacterized protein YkwD